MPWIQKKKKKTRHHLNITVGAENFYKWALKSIPQRARKAFCEHMEEKDRRHKTGEGERERERDGEEEQIFVHLRLKFLDVNMENIVYAFSCQR